jgi:UMF1 family MFS transporter
MNQQALKYGEAKRGEILAWASYDVANATYATIVATTVYNPFFINVVAGQAVGSHGTATLFLSGTICLSSILIVLTAPILGTIADATACKKKLLFCSTGVCIVATACLGLFGKGQYIPAMIVLTIANTAFGTGEDFIASFLPELASREKMGRISAIGWGAGYVGGLFSLGTSLLFLTWAQNQHMTSEQFVPVIMLGCALFFAILSLPTLLFLRERAQPDPTLRKQEYVRIGLKRFQNTLRHALHYRDLFNLLLAICVYSCGIMTVTHLASVYAQEVMGFTQKESLILILIVNVTATIGAFTFGWVQDKIGSVRTLVITLSIWVVAILMAYLAHTKFDLFIASNFMGIAIGASGSAGRALVGRFSPEGRSGEFLGLWGVAVKLATAIGVLTFGLVTYVTHSNFRFALLFTLGFFVLGLLLLLRVNEARGIAAANSAELH